MDTISQIAADHAELADDLRRQGVKDAMGGWIDVLGRSKSKIVPIDHLPQLLAGSERYTPRGMGGIGAMTPPEDECVALPDLATLQVFPWDSRFAWMAAAREEASRGAKDQPKPIRQGSSGANYSERALRCRTRQQRGNFASSGNFARV